MEKFFSPARDGREDNAKEVAKEDAISESEAEKLVESLLESFDRKDAEEIIPKIVRWVKEQPEPPFNEGRGHEDCFAIEKLLMKKIEKEGVLNESIFLLISELKKEKLYESLTAFVQECADFDPYVIEQIFHHNPNSEAGKKELSKILDALLNVAFGRVIAHALSERMDYDQKYEDVLKDDKFFYNLYFELKDKQDFFKGDLGRKVDILIAELEKSETEAGMLASIIKNSIINKEKIDFKEIINLHFLKKEIGESLDFEKKEEILDLAKENYQEGDIEFTELKRGLEEIKNQRTYLLEFQGELMAFCRFKPIPGKDEVYGGSLNLQREIQGLSLGRHFVKSVLEQESKENSIKAIVQPRAVGFYKKLGFAIEGDSFEEGGKEYVSMILKKTGDNWGEI